MSKISLIIEREYLTRVRKKSFIVMSIVGPLLIVALYAIPIWLALSETNSKKQIGVIDNVGEFKTILANTSNLEFVFLRGETDTLKKVFFDQQNFDALMYRERQAPFSEKGIVLTTVNQMSIDLENEIETELSHGIERYKMNKLGVRQATLDSLRTNVHLDTRKANSQGRETATSKELEVILGFVLAFFIYFIIFMYGSQVMRGVIEEKTSRIIEVIISSVRPFELMMGKILGVALVVLTQIVIWGVLSTVIISTISVFVGNVSPEIIATTSQVPNVDMNHLAETPLANHIFESFLNLNLPMIIFGFVFYFIGGYLTYAALFAAIGSAVDNETDTQQFILPISMPMILSFVVASQIMRDPDGSLAFWLSIIPFTSPIAMIVRLPQNPPMWQLALSMVLLVVSFIGTTWMASKIYRVGILMYGKKTTYKELWKWMWYKV